MDKTKAIGIALLVVALMVALPLVSVAETNENVTAVTTVTAEEETYLPIDEGIYFPEEGSIFFTGGSYQVSWMSPDIYGTPLISIGLASAGNNTSPLDAEWVVVRDGTTEDGSYNWYVPYMETGGYKLIIVLDYPGMMGTYHQEILYGDDFYIINATIFSPV